MKSKGKTKLHENRLNRKDLDEQHDQSQDHEIDRFGVKLIKGIGVFGVILGAIILVAFWYWLFRLLYNAA
jgi:hypothetical protein